MPAIPNIPLSYSPEQLEANQKKLIKYFNLPEQARNVELLSIASPGEFGMSFDGQLKWEQLVMVKKYDEVFDREIELPVWKPFARDLGRSNYNWVSEALK